MLLGMFDGVYAREEFARLLALVPDDATGAVIVFRPSGQRTTINATVGAVSLELWLSPWWARGDRLGVSLDAATLARVRADVDATPTEGVWLHVEPQSIDVRSTTNDLPRAPCEGAQGKARPMTDSARDRWWCSECANVAQQRPPVRWPDAWGTAPDYSHADGSPLCPTATLGGYEPCRPVRQRPESLAGNGDPPPPPLPARWCAALMVRTADDLYTAVMGGDAADLGHLLGALADTLRSVNALTAYAEARLQARGLTATARRATQTAALTEAAYHGLAGLLMAYGTANRHSAGPSS